MLFPKIQFVFFDLGRVIVDFCHDRASDNLSLLTGVDAKSIEKSLFKTGLQTQFELGKIDQQEFTNALNIELGTQLPTETLCRAVSDMFGLNSSIMPLLVQLVAARVPVGILSNTCIAHWEFILDKYPVINQLIPQSHRVLSFECFSMKPDQTIYETAINNAGIAAENIFFMDDRMENVHGAQKAGMQAELFVDTRQILNILSARNVVVNL